MAINCFKQLYYISIGSSSDQEHIPMHVYLGLYTNQKHIAITMDIFQQSPHTSLGSYADQEHFSITMDFFRQ